MRGPWQRWQAERWLEPLQVILLLPAVIVGMILPLDFLRQIDGYRMYLRPLAHAQLFAFAVLVYVFFALVLTLPLAVGVWLLTRWTPWPPMIIFRTVFGGYIRCHLRRDPEQEYEVLAAAFGPGVVPPDE